VCTLCSTLVDTRAKGRSNHILPKNSRDGRCTQNFFNKIITRNGGPGSVVGIATAYGLDGPGIESRWGEILRAIPDRP